MNSKMLRLSLLSCLFVSAFLSSCTTKSDDNEQNVDINRFFVNYIELTYGKNNDSLKTIGDNIYMITRQEGTGLKPTLTADTADFVEVCYTGRAITSSGNAVFTTTNRNLAFLTRITAVSSVQDTAYLNMALPGSIVTPWTNGLRKALMNMREGGKAFFIMGPQWGFSASGYSSISYTNYVPAYASMSYEVQLIKVIKNPITYDTTRLAKCLKVFNKTTNDSVKKAGTPIYIVNEVAGTNDTLATTGDTVYLKCKGYLLPKKNINSRADVLSGVVIFNNEKYYTVIDGTSKSSFSGLNAALKTLKIGSSGILLFPYISAYGTAGNLPDVPQYSSLIYEYKILRIGRKK